jgi:hypothetical protein
MVIDRMLAKNPDHRFQTPAEVIAALTPWLPGSDKVLAGISRTDMARTPELQNTLNEMVNETTKRLTRRYSSTNLGLPSRWPVLAAGAAGVVVVLGLIVAAVAGAFSSGSRTKETTVAVAPEPTPPAPNPAPPKKDTNSPKKTPDPTPPAVVVPLPPPAVVAPRSADVVYSLDLTGRGKFAEKGKVIGDPNRPSTLKWHFASQSGTGQFPAGWKPSATTPNGEYDGAVADAEGGGLALVVHPVGSAATSLLAPEVPFPSGRARLQVTYRTESADGQVAVQFHPDRPREAAGWKAGTLPATGGEWATKELDVALKGATGGRFEFVAGADLKAGVAIKGFTAIDPSPAPKKPLLKLDTDHLQPFVQRTRKFQTPGSTVPLTVISEAGPGKIPSGWYRWMEFENSVAEFFAEGTPGAMVLGLRNIQGQPSVQYSTPEIKPKGNRVRIRVLYQTGPTSPGVVIRFRPTRPKGATFDVTTLLPTGGSWRAQVIDVDLRGSNGGLFELYNAGEGPNAAVRFRAFVVTDAAD